MRDELSLDSAIHTAKSKYPNMKWTIIAFRSTSQTRFRIYRRATEFRMKHTRIGESPQRAAFAASYAHGGFVFDPAYGLLDIPPREAI